MEEMCGFHSMSDYTVSPETNLISPTEYNADLCTSVDHYRTFYGSDNVFSSSASVITEAVSVAATPEQILLPRHRSNQNINDRLDEDHHVDARNDIIKAKIVSHPLYPKLLDASIDCRKVSELKRNRDSLFRCLEIKPNRDSLSRCVDRRGIKPNRNSNRSSICELVLKSISA